MITLIDWDGASISYHGTLQDAIELFHISKDCYWKVCLDGKVIIEWKLVGGKYECISFEI